jgi:hypothetical protein
VAVRAHELTGAHGGNGVSLLQHLRVKETQVEANVSDGRGAAACPPLQLASAQCGGGRHDAWHPHSGSALTRLAIVARSVWPSGLPWPTDGPTSMLITS